MNLTDLKTKNTQELIDIAKDMGLDNMARSRKQDIIFAVLKRHAKVVIVFVVRWSHGISDCRSSADG